MSRIKQELEVRKCSKCGSDKTYVGKTGTPYWTHDKEGNLICRKCYSNIWNGTHFDHSKAWRIRNPEYNKQYYLDNRKKILEQQKKYNIDNHDKILEYHKQYRIDNRKKILEYLKQYYRDSYEHIKQYRIDNRDRLSVYNMIMQPRKNQLQRIRRAIKRGYGWTS